MKVLVTLLIVALVHVAFGLPKPRIVGGEDAPVGKYPHQIALKYRGSHFCGGAILNKRYILTAAHCIKGLKARDFTVTVGINLLTESGTTFQVEKLIPHKGFSESTALHDIGLVLVNKDITFTDKIKPISLPKKDINTVGYPVVATGWGAGYPGGNSINRLQEITLKLTSMEECKKKWSVSSTQLCTLTKAGEGMCKGDSGGPLVADNVIIGLTSFGLPCARGYPDVFTRVYSYVDWIDANMDP